MPLHIPHLRRSFLTALMVLIGTALLVPQAAMARESRTVGDLEFNVGFMTEPPIQSDTNGLRVQITQGGEPVEGIAETLQAQAIFGDQARNLPLMSTGEPGVYTSVFIPTQAGEYSFRLLGTINDQEIDETFHSSPEGVPLVAARTDYEFPLAAFGSSSTLTYPAIAGGLLLAAGGIGILLQRQRH